MKRTFVLGASVALGVAMAAGSALAAPTLSWSGNAKGTYELYSYKTAADSHGPNNTLSIGLTASNPGVWTLSAAGVTLLSTGATAAPSWGNAKLTVTEPEFNLLAATGNDGWELDHVHDGINDDTYSLFYTGDNKGGFQVTSHGATVQLISNGVTGSTTTFSGPSRGLAEYSMPFGSTTVGVIGAGNFGTGGGPLSAGAWASQTVDGISLTGEVADSFPATSTTDTAAYALKAGSGSLTPNISAWATYTHKGSNFASPNGKAGNAIDVNADYYTNGVTANDGIRVHGDYNTDQPIGGVQASDINGYVQYNGDAKNLGWGDVFDNPEDYTPGDTHYYKNVALGAYAGIDSSKSSPTATPTNTLTLKATSPVIPNQLWVYASDVIASNSAGMGSVTRSSEDGWSSGSATIASPTSTNALEAVAYYQLTDKLNLQPHFDLYTATDGTNSLSQTSVGSRATYALGPGANSRLYADYTLQNTKGGSATVNDSTLLTGYEVDF